MTPVSNFVNDPEAFSAEYEEFQRLLEELSREEYEQSQEDREG